MATPKEIQQQDSKTPPQNFSPISATAPLKSLLRAWLAVGPLPLSTYGHTFGNHKGKLPTEVPDTYLVNYLISTRFSGQIHLECPIVGDAIEDFMQRNPGVWSLAGPRKMVMLEEGVLQAPPLKKKRGRLRSEGVLKS